MIGQSFLEYLSHWHKWSKWQKLCNLVDSYDNRYTVGIIQKRNCIKCNKEQWKAVRH